MSISFKPHHGVSYQRFLIFRVYPTGKIKRIGKMLAPNLELARLKAKELWSQEPSQTTLLLETPEQTQQRLKAMRKKKRR